MESNSDLSIMKSPLKCCFLLSLSEMNAVEHSLSKAENMYLELHEEDSRLSQYEVYCYSMPK